MPRSQETNLEQREHGSADRACALFSYPSMDPSLSALCSRFIKHCTH
ncbi:hypothetical protein NC653_021008 [Populus alba x Populus x berolinensis]|uniref:Uncharacterized protein n=1 Tax=Populus alba x Populus x berolinensis TaxID=444605 RepID=A0AAD6QD90_9ROSI|nr:hypothetical protein NC653_021008 [Populus alba x Populus x berolinensis]